MTTSACGTAARAAASPRATEACRERGEPATTSIPPRRPAAAPADPSDRPSSSARNRSTSSAGAVTTTWLTTPEAMSPAAARRRRLTPPTGTRALGTPAPRREPEPAAVRTATAPPGADSGGADAWDEGLVLTGRTLPRPRRPEHERCARRRGPRPAGTRPPPQGSSEPGPARRRESGGPWRACASRRRTGRGPCHDGRGPARPRRP